MQSLDSKRVIDWRKRARKVLLEVLGNKCAICGYEDDFSGSYDIHHIDSSKKEINFGNLSTLGIRPCLIEAKKCVLLCAICHRKVHAGLLDINEAKYYYDDNKADLYLSFGKAIPSSADNLDKRVLSSKKHYCPECGIEISDKSKHCEKCLSFLRRKLERPLLEDLNNDIVKLGYSGTGRKYGVSDNTIRKWTKTTT